MKFKLVESKGIEGTASSCFFRVESTGEQDVCSCCTCQQQSLC